MSVAKLATTHVFVRGFDRHGIGDRVERSKIGAHASFVCYALHAVYRDKPPDGSSGTVVWARVTAGECKANTGALCIPAISSETA